MRPIRRQPSPPCTVPQRLPAAPGRPRMTPAPGPDMYLLGPDGMPPHAMVYAAAGATGDGNTQSLDHTIRRVTMARLTPITSKDQVAAKDHAIVDAIVGSRGAL